MLRAINNAEFVRLPLTLGAIFSGRYTVQLGQRPIAVRWRKQRFLVLKAGQQDKPRSLGRDGNRTLWCYQNVFYWGDRDLESDDVRALVHRRDAQKRQKLQTARSLMNAHERGTPVRVNPARELRRAVFDRDGGKCVECGSTFDLQYDHIIPVALGGATTLENLQLLCADCNRDKRDDL